ncbi:MAG: glycosyltransferase family 39 protein [Bacteroidota bacterium]|nr:glycosyltransferase family 39 protein [Bacteroidota bacterium]
MAKRRLNLLLSDIRFWILIAFVIRIYGLTFSPLETNHNWRQTTVSMVARNFLEVSNNIFYPRIDFAGDKTGITGMEFPFFNYLIYLFSRAFGYDHWYGRLINLMVSSTGIFYFFKLLKLVWNKKLAFLGTFVLIFSHWFKYGRKIMPDTFAISIVIIGLYYGYVYLKEGRYKHLLLAFLLLPLGTLSKLPAGYAYSFFIFPFLDGQIDWRKKVFLLGGLCPGLIFIIFWYFYWSPYLTQHFGFYHFFSGKSFSSGLSEILSEPILFLKNFYEHPLHFVGFGLFLLGVFFIIKKKEWHFFYVFLLGLFAYLPIILKAGWTFVHHSYYMVPLTPLLALIAGYGLSEIKSQRLTVLFLIGFVADNFFTQKDDFTRKKDFFAFESLEKDLSLVGASNKDLIVINSHPNPTPFYFSHRKGWLMNNEEIAEPKKLLAHTNGKAKYIIVAKKSFGENMQIRFTPMLSKEAYDIYDINDFYPPKK